MDNIIETRYKREDGTYDISLEVKDSAYFNVFDNADTTSGKEFLRDYLKSNADDARYADISVNHNKGRRIVSIKAKLDYEGNMHTSYDNRRKLY